MSKCFNRECYYNENNICKFNDGKNIEKCRWYEKEIKTSRASDFVDLLNKEMYELKISNLEAKIECLKNNIIDDETLKELVKEHQMYKDLEAKLAEKEKEQTDRMMAFEKRCQEYYKSNEYKISFAVEKLTEVKEYCIDNGYVVLKLIYDYIDNQIKAIKEKDNG